MMKFKLNDFLETIKAYWLFLLPHYLFSRLTYVITRTRNPLVPFLIRFYVKLFKVNLNECIETSPDKYETFCDFFTRKLKPGIHKIDSSENSVVSTCDGSVTELGKIKDNSILQVKGKKIHLDDLLGYDKQLKNEFDNGSFLTIYLSPKDYHRVHMPCYGKLLKTIHVPGRLFSVAKHAVNKIKNLYARNERLICKFKNEATSFSVIFVAAINVSSIEVSWKGEASPPYPKRTISSNYSKKKITYDKGEEFGMFKSGSTVIILFDDTVEISKEIRKGQKIRVGQKIGLLK